MNTTTPQTRYSDEELEEFRELIETKIKKATAEYDALAAQISGDKSHDGDDTTRPYKDLLDESQSNTTTSEARRLMDRQAKFIEKLRAALLRIDNKTYGICRETGKLIPKDRLRAVPHATLSIEAKQK